MTDAPAVLKRATTTAFSKNRADVNKQLGTTDFDGWLASLIRSVPFDTALDLCCGTGNQLVSLLGVNPNAVVTGVDVAAESLNIAGNRVNEAGTSVTLIESNIDKVFAVSEISYQRFDLVTCAYGLYYSRNVDALLRSVIDHLSDTGSILIVGPYGRNNFPLFDLLSRHFDLPYEVVRSCTSFMTEEVLPLLEARLCVREETFVNKVVYPDADAVMSYWRATTFFDPSAEKAVQKDVEEHVAKHGEFCIEKHVMAITAGRKES